ncbi:hypothetical protein STTU_2882 [Streptomyces sp. Tu6071]|nr:hypothetical protein STTU_2882 [Streptomyces sp. Tu6071]
MDLCANRSRGAGRRGSQDGNRRGARAAVLGEQSRPRALVLRADLKRMGRGTGVPPLS